MLKKKFAAVIAVILLLSVTGCNAVYMGTLNLGIAKLDLDKEQSVTAKIHCAIPEKQLITAELHRFSAGVWENTITDPYPLQGINVLYDKGITTLTFAGLTAEENPAFSSVLDVVVSSLDHAFTSAPKVKVRRNTVTLTGETDNGPYTLKLENSTLKTLEVPDKEIKVEFA
jgi:hypothetical protein